MSTIGTLDLATGTFDALVENVADGLSVRLDRRGPCVGDFYLLVPRDMDLSDAMMRLLDGTLQPQRCWHPADAAGRPGMRAIALTVIDASAPPREPIEIKTLTWQGPGAAVAVPAPPVTCVAAQTLNTVVTLHMGAGEGDPALEAWRASGTGASGWFPGDG